MATKMGHELVNPTGSRYVYVIVGAGTLEQVPWCNIDYKVRNHTLSLIHI